MRQLTNTRNSKRVLFLGYDKSQTTLIDEIIRRGAEVWHADERVTLKDTTGFDILVSFGYRHILSKELIDNSPPIINLHVSYLPFNRGARPNYWSFVDGTPHGVSIHKIDAGIDTGPILFQQFVNFHKSEDTFARTQTRLINEMQHLFTSNLDTILFAPLQGTPQRKKGTYHAVTDLPEDFPGCDTKISDWLAVIDQISAAPPCQHS